MSHFSDHLPESIRLKMEKLLAMAESQANQHEAAIATEKLHQLLVQYNYSLRKLQGSVSVEEIGASELVDQKRPWVWMIVQAIAGLNFCSEYASNQKSNRRYIIIGTHTNRLVSVQLIEAVLSTIKREATIGSKQQYGRRHASYITSFYHAAASRIYSRCNEMRESAKQGKMKGETGENLPALRALYDQHQQENQAYLHNTVGDLQKARTRQTVLEDHRGYYDGIKTGSRINLGRNIASEKTRNSLLRLIRLPKY